MSHEKRPQRDTYEGSIFNIISNRLDIIGIDIAIIMILLPISILLAIAPSPASLHTLTANSAKNAIPVIFNNIAKNVLFIDAFDAKDCNSDITCVSWSITNNNIKTPANKLIYIANSGLYCFNKIIMIRATKPIPIILIIILLSLKKQ